MAEDEPEVTPARKVLVLNVGQYVGANISKRFAASEDEKFQIIGTLNGPSEQKPRWVSSIVESTPETLKAAFLECEFIVLDCLGQRDASEALLAAIAPIAEFEAEKVLVGISSVMTWTRTSPDADEPEKPLTEEEYKRRRPHSRFKELLAVEKLVTKAKRPGLRTHVVAAGLTYGAEEDVLHRLFKVAWSCEALPLLSTADGSNLLPTIHIADLCSVVAKLLESDSVPYLLAVDAGQQQETPPTLEAVTAKLSAELGVGEVKPVAAEEVRLQTDFEFYQLGVRLQAAAIEDLGIEWHCKEGLLANMTQVVREFREARGLQPLRVLVHGNDAIAKCDLAGAIANEYKLTHVNAAAVLAAKADGVDDKQALAAALTTINCRNQGYVLQGYPDTCEQASALFSKPAEGEEAAEPAEAEGEEAAATAPGVATSPEFVLVLEADDEAIKSKTLAMDNPPTTEAALDEQLAAYATHNAEDSPSSVLALPAFAALESLPMDATRSVDVLLTKASTYLGPRRNYGPTAVEIEAKGAILAAEASKIAQLEAAVTSQREADEKAERERRVEHDKQRVAELMQQERELLEVRSLPLRNYLMQNVIPTLTEGIIEVCKVKPEDPIDYLAEYLFKNSPEENE